MPTPTGPLMYRKNNAARTRKRADVGAKVGRPSKRMTQTTLEVVAAAAMKSPDTIDTTALAKAVHMSPEHVKAKILEARQKLQAAAPQFVDNLIHAAQVAAARGNSAPAEFAIERIAEGEARIIDPPKQQAVSNMPVINIGLALGGARTLHSAEPAVEVQALPAAVPVQHDA